MLCVQVYVQEVSYVAGTNTRTWLTIVFENMSQTSLQCCRDSCCAFFWSVALRCVLRRRAQECPPGEFLLSDFDLVPCDVQRRSFADTFLSVGCLWSGNRGGTYEHHIRSSAAVVCTSWPSFTFLWSFRCVLCRNARERSSRDIFPSRLQAVVCRAKFSLRLASGQKLLVSG